MAAVRKQQDSYSYIQTSETISQNIALLWINVLPDVSVTVVENELTQ